MTTNKDLTQRALKATDFPCLRKDYVMGLLPLALNDFRAFFTLFPKCFSSFVHTTCSLSVLVQYLAFAARHQRLAQHYQTARLLESSGMAESMRTDMTGLSPSTVALSRAFRLTMETFPRPLHYNSTASGSFRCGFKHRLDPCSLAVTQGITVVFLSSAK